MESNLSFTAGQLATGRGAAFTNAEQLVKDAELLLAAGHHVHALLFAQIAIEEVEKVCLLAGYALLLAQGQVDSKRFWKSFRMHAHNLESLRLIDGRISPTLTEAERQAELAAMKERARDLELGKPWSVYVELVEAECC